MKRFAILCALGLPLGAGACRSTAPGNAPRPDEVVPGLEQIFLQPPITGQAPTLDSISADGRHVLLRWAPPEAHREGRRAPLRLLDVHEPGRSDHRGLPLEELVPPSDPEKSEDEAINTVRWSPEGHVLAVARGRSLWLLDAETKQAVRAIVSPPPPITDDEEQEEDEEENVEAEQADGVAVVGPTGPTLGSIKSIRFSRDGRELRFSDRDELYSIDLPDGAPPEKPVPLEDATWWSEKLDGTALALDWSQDLSVVFGDDPTPFGQEEDDPDEPDVNEDEDEDEDELDPDPAAEVAHVFLLREERAVVLEGLEELAELENTSLSPDGRFVVGFHVDRGGEPAATLVPNYLTERVTMVETRKKLADDGPSPLRGFVWRTGSGERTALGRLQPETGDGASPGDFDSFWPRSIGWAPMLSSGRPARFAFERLSEDFRQLEIFTWTEGQLKRIWNERDERWIGGPARYSRWSHDGRLLLLGSESYEGSTTPGHCQLFAVDPESGQIHQLTEVGGEVSRFNVARDGDLVIEASFEDPARRAVARLDAAWLSDPATAGEHWERLPGPEGWNSGARWSNDASSVAFSHESLMQPAEIWWTDGTETVQLTRTTPDEYTDVDWIHPRKLELTSEDGRTLRAHVYLPPGTRLENNASPRASIVFVHGAGYLQNVTDSMTRYPLNAMFHSRLAHMGYPVIDVDYRGSAGYGRDFRTDVQYHLGGKDLDDIQAVVDHLVDEGLVDPERVGIYGGSYGGFMALMALFTAPENWAAGAALRSVTDWRTYHPVYTQPRLGRPSTHAEAYALSSPIDHAEKLEDPLLILHGMLDRNVFAQDSVRLIEKLIDLQLEFDAMLYPSQGHAFADGPHWLDEYRRIEGHMLEHLGPPQLP